MVFFLRKLNKNVDRNLLLAGYAKDLEKAIPEFFVYPTDHGDYESYLVASHTASANAMRGVLCESGILEDDKNDICHLISGQVSSASDIERYQSLCDADALSFFYVRLPFYYNSDEAVLQERCQLEYESMSNKAKEMLLNMRLCYSSRKINTIVARILGRNIFEEVVEKHHNIPSNNVQDNHSFAEDGGASFSVARLDAGGFGVPVNV